MPPRRPARLEVDMKIGVLGLAAFETAGENSLSLQQIVQRLRASRSAGVAAFIASGIPKQEQ
jgi:hypothetical protein